MRTEENRQEFYEFWLAGIQGIPGRKKIRLKSLFPEPKELYRLKPAQVSRIPFLTDLEKERLQESQRQPEAEIARQIETCQETGISLVLREDASYPSRLRDIYNPPYALYCRGSLPEDVRPAVALVGARNCSPYGKAVAKSVACHLAMAGLSVISGLDRKSVV